MAKKEYTIKQASEALDVSPTTVRRRIKSGKINAEKRTTEYGPTYFIPAEEIDQAIMEKDVVEVTQPVDVEDLEDTLLKAIDRKNKAVAEEVMDKVENNFKRQNKAIKDLTNKVDELNNEIKQLKDKTIIDKIKDFFT